MHDELRDAGLRRVRLWTLILLVIGGVAGAFVAGVGGFDPEWPPSLDLAGGRNTLLYGAAGGLVFTLLLLVVAADRWAARQAWPIAPHAEAPDLAWIVEGIALARGIPAPKVWRVSSGAPNVACLPGGDGTHLIVSTAAEGGMARDELEALAALQLSLLLDRSAARVRRPLYATARAILWMFRAAAVATAVATVRHVFWAGLTINLGVWITIGLTGLFVVGQRRLRWAWGIVGDAVAIETTRHPEPLIRALRRLAGYNGPQVSVRRSWGASDPYWAAPVRRHISVSTMVVSSGGRERARTRRTTEQVSDAALLLRAGIVERMCLGGDPATLAGWKEAEAVFDRLARYGGDGGEVDGTVDGVEVTIEGAGTGALPPVSGEWPVPAT